MSNGATDSTRKRLRQRAATIVAATEVAAGADLPQFVKNAFDAFLECGILANGFTLERRGFAQPQAKPFREEA